MDILSLILYWTFLPLGGKTLAILGGRATGKSSLKKFLETGKIPDSYKVTDIAEQYASFRSADLRIRIQASQDVGGGDDPKPIKAYYDAWETVVKSSDYVFYLINLYLFLFNKDESNNGKYKERVKNDLLQIIKWVQKDKPIIIVGTYADKDKRFSIDDTNKAKNQIKEIQDQLMHDNIMNGFFHKNRFGEDYVIIIGSLVDNKFAKNLVCELAGKLDLVRKISKRNQEAKKKENNKKDKRK
ncbi:MAG: hypothetical protein F6K63_12160 [Moorea sp. SIO1G6]|uniref:hypothetical protein n=1 Tax=Moorena sp. SIO1G6 TaxID=2607840 RepID=UPI0013C0D8A4|nr:hypothetical protein [Moorena sp. SIO1G6]NET65095.1 hypothetical protein [Moorena sp. SIO1G6]